MMHNVVLGHENCEVREVFTLMIWVRFQLVDSNANILVVRSRTTAIKNAHLQQRKHARAFSHVKNPLILFALGTR